jgi:hypothetical protein
MNLSGECDGKVVRLDHQNASAAYNIVPAANHLHAVASNA